MARKEKLQKPVKREAVKPKEAVAAKRRAKPGKAALREVRREQKSTKTLLKKTPMGRLIREIANDPKIRFFPSSESPRFRPDAIEALIIAAEAKVVHFMRSVNFIACQRGGKTITLSDVRTHKALNSIKPV